MTSREKFEAWYLESWGHTEDDHETLFERDPDSDEDYYRLGVRLAHEAWQAAELASEQKLTDMAVQLANAESKCRDLAAENAGMKQLASEAYDEMVSHHDTDGLYSLDADGEQMDALIRLCDAQDTIYDTLVMCETPATDAFLSEVRAQGVESYAEQLKSEADRAEETGWEDAAKFLRSESEKVQEFAAQLRKGGKA